MWTCNTVCDDPRLYAQDTRVCNGFKQLPAERTDHWGRQTDRQTPDRPVWKPPLGAAIRVWDSDMGISRGLWEDPGVVLIELEPPADSLYSYTHHYHQTIINT